MNDFFKNIKSAARAYRNKPLPSLINFTQPYKPTIRGILSKPYTNTPMTTVHQLKIEKDDMEVGVYRLNSIIHSIWLNSTEIELIDDTDTRLPTSEYEHICVSECPTGELVGFLRYSHQEYLSLFIENDVYHVEFGDGTVNELSKNNAPFLPHAILGEEIHEFVLDYAKIK